MKAKADVRRCRICGCTDEDCSGCMGGKTYRCSATCAEVEAAAGLANKVAVVMPNCSASGGAM